MEILSTLETGPRDAYCGAIDSDADTLEAVIAEMLVSTSFNPFEGMRW